MHTSGIPTLLSSLDHLLSHLKKMSFVSLKQSLTYLSLLIAFYSLTPNYRLHTVRVYGVWKCHSSQFPLRHQNESPLAFCVLGSSLYSLLPFLQEGLDLAMYVLSVT